MLILGSISVPVPAAVVVVRQVRLPGPARLDNLGLQGDEPGADPILLLLREPLVRHPVGRPDSRAWQATAPMTDARNRPTGPG